MHFNDVIGSEKVIRSNRSDVVFICEVKQRNISEQDCGRSETGAEKNEPQEKVKRASVILWYDWTKQTPLDVHRCR